MRFISVSTLAIFLWQCNGENEENPNDNTDNTECQAGIDAFKTNIQPAIDKQDGCSGNIGCHVANNTGGTDLYFETGEANAIANRDNLLDHDSGNYAKGSNLLNKITENGFTHTGGNRVEKGNITEAAVTAWVRAEEGCK